MIHRITFLVCVGLMLLAAGPAPRQALAQPSLADSPYYPLKVGSTWHYRAGDEKIVVRVVAHEKVGELQCAKVEATEKETKKVEYIAVMGDGLFRTKIKDKELKPPLCFFKLPPMTGQTWKVESEVDGVKIRGTFTIDMEDVTVPAGKFQAFKVSCKDFTIGERVMALTYWFAKDKGIVKQRLEIAGFDLVLELEKFEPGQ